MLTELDFFFFFAQMFPLMCVYMLLWYRTLEDRFVHAGHTRAIMLPRKALDVNLQWHWAN